jgi:hypothetical protein
LAKQGFYLGGGFASQDASGDLDGKGQVTNGAGDRLGSFGKLDSGTGNTLDIGYNFNRYFGFEYFSVATSHHAKHELEAGTSNAVAASALLGVRLSAPMADWLEGFLRVGNGTSAVRYETFGHEGTTSAGVFTPTADKAFRVSGNGIAYGLGVQVFAGRHIGIAFGYTRFPVKYDRASIGGDSAKSLPKTLSETLTASDMTITYPF